MRLSVIPDDNTVCIDGLCKRGIDMSSIAPNVHAFQWYETWGDLEIVNSETGKPENIKVHSLDDFQDVINQWENMNS
jgi:hypothetical protein